jgi:hypothetical protein
MARAKPVNLSLTLKEAMALHHACIVGTEDDQIDNIGFTPTEKRAYLRAERKLDRCLAVLIEDMLAESDE